MLFPVFSRSLLLLLGFLLMGIHLHVFAQSIDSTEKLLTELSASIKNAPNESVKLIEQLENRELTFTPIQMQHFVLLNSASLGLQGKNLDRIALILPFIKQVTDPDYRVKFLYELSSAYTNQGDYENALIANNESIAFLPKIVSINAKISVLSASVKLLNTLGIYDESMLFANRMYALTDDSGSSVAKCHGLADKIEINFLRGESELARSRLTEVISICDSNNRKMVSLVIKALAAVDLINTNRIDEGINTGIDLLEEFSKTKLSSDYLTKLEDAMARGFLKKNNLARAEQYGLHAFERASQENSAHLKEIASETMAKIKRAQGQLNSAIEYYDINLALKKKILDEQLQKNLAYQRVKFDAQDKANQLALSEHQNRTLTMEKALQLGKNQNLLLLVTLGLILMTILGAWSLRILRQKNVFRTSAQIDGLTQVSNRAHFMESSSCVFKNTDDAVSVVLFDMDHFKKINDTFGHAAGDWVLKTVCEVVKAQLRKSDVLGRLGGEEFAMCLPNFTESEVLTLAERCRSAIAAIDTNPCGFSFIITASFGIATRGKRGYVNFEETLAAADKALYFSKNEGRNRVSVYQ